jgi:hypothetical protein
MINIRNPLKIKHLFIGISMLSLIGLGACTVDKPPTQPELATQSEFATQPRIDYAAMVKGFGKVPLEAKMRVWWFWLEGQATKKSITQDLEAMAGHGVGGAVICDNGAGYTTPGPVFMGNEWKALFAHTIQESTRLGIEISANIQSGCGDPGNPNIANDNGLKRFVSSEKKVVGPARIDLPLPTPRGGSSDIFYKDIAVQAVKGSSSDARKDKVIKNWGIKMFHNRYSEMNKFYETYPDEGEVTINPDEIIDLTPQFKNGVLRWEVPEGNWTIIRYGMASTGKRNNYASQGYKNGLSYDPMNKRGAIAHFNDVAKPMIDIAKQNGTSLKFVHIDSWEMQMCNWTQGLEDAFKKRRGYDMHSYMPVLAGHIVGSREISNRFLEDYRLTVCDLIAEENYQLVNTLADKEGVSFHAESAGMYKPPIDGLRTLGATDIPMGEAWARRPGYWNFEANRMQVALGASAAHIYGKRYLAAEAPTSMGPIFERSPSQVKHVLDRIFCTGVNRLNWHTYTSSPDEFGLPGVAYFAGTHLNRNVTWWQESKEFIAYINRTQNMLIQGLHVADVLGYLGSRAPQFADLPHLERNDIPVGYAWDMCNADAFLKRASVKDGRVVLSDGKSYALFALSDDKQMFLPLLKKIETMVKDGMVLVGNPPERTFGLTDYPEWDSEFSAIVKRIWGDADGSVAVIKQYGKGRVYVGQTVDRVLKTETIGPDLKWQQNKGVDLEYIHRTSLDGDVDVYYVINKRERHGIDDMEYRYIPTLPDRFVNVRCSFRITGDRQIERWDPVSGRITPVTIYEKKDGYYQLPVSLEPEGGAFYVFRKAQPQRNIVRITQNGVPLTEGNTPLNVGASKVFVTDGQLEVGEKGSYEVTFVDGKTTKIENPKMLDVVAIKGPWKLDFMEKPQLGQPFSATYPSLKSWTESDNRAEKYFSGTARYTRSFKLSSVEVAKDRRVYLDLGYVGDVATVRVNGREVGILWKAPYIADVTEFVKLGENALEIDVSNLWINRLVGDQKLPLEQRKTNTNLTAHDFYKRMTEPDADKYLRVSGLIGPVEIRISNLHRIDD